MASRSGSLGRVSCLTSLCRVRQDGLTLFHCFTKSEGSERQHLHPEPLTEPSTRQFSDFIGSNQPDSEVVRDQGMPFAIYY